VIAVGPPGPAKPGGVAQKGIALITVLLIVVFLSVFAITEAEKQDISIRKVSNLVESEQAFQIAVGGEQWAIKMLEKDIKADSENDAGLFVDHAGEAWANLGPGVKVEGTESYMRVSIFDMHGFFNVNNLIQGRKAIEGDQNEPEDESENGDRLGQTGGSESGVDNDDSGSESEDTESADGQNDAQSDEQKKPTQPSWYSIFQSLLLNLELDPSLADALVDWIDTDDEVSGAEGAEDQYYLSLDPPYLPANQPLVSIGELINVKGFTSEVLQVLEPYIIALPVTGIDNLTKINVNSASSVVLGSLVSQPGISTDDLVPLIEIREAEPFESTADFSSLFDSISSVRLKAGSQALLDVKAEYFFSHSCAQTGKVELSQLSLLRKDFSEKRVSVVLRLRKPSCPELVETIIPKSSS